MFLTNIDATCRFQSEKSFFALICYLISHSHTDWRYTLSVQNINIEFQPLLPSEQPQFIGTWTPQGVESVPQGWWPMLTPMLPTVVLSWLDVLWVVDHSWYTRKSVEWKTQQRCSSWFKMVRLAPTTKPVSNVMSCPFTLWMAHIHNPCLNSLKA